MNTVATSFAKPLKAVAVLVAALALALCFSVTLAVQPAHADGKYAYVRYNSDTHVMRFYRSDKVIENGYQLGANTY